MKKPLSTILGLALVALSVSAASLRGPHQQAGEATGQADSAQVAPIHLVVLHTNDIHGQVLPRPGTWLSREDPPQVGGIVRLAAYVNSVRREHAGPGRDVLLVDAGDWYQGTPEGLIELGLPFVRALSAVGYDALAIGNHEFDHGLANATRLLAEGVPRAICANIEDRETGQPVDWAVPYRIVEKAGLRIALVGLVTTSTPEISHVDTRTKLRFVDTVAAYERVLAELQASTEPIDLVIPVGHVGVPGDQRLARAHPELDLIVGGHDHRFLGEGLREGDTLIVQAGARASVCGRVDLLIDSQTRRVIESRATLVDLLEVGTDKDQNALVSEIATTLAALSNERMSAVIGELSAPLERSRELRTSVAGAFLADAVRERMQADIGLMNRGGVRSDIPAGPVTRRQLFEIAPFDNYLVAMTLSGADLATLFERSFDGSHSGLDPSGCRFVLDAEAEGSARLVRVEVAGRALDPEASYRVATNSFLAEGGDGFVELQGGRERESDPILLRDLLEEVFVREQRIDPPADERWSVER